MNAKIVKLYDNIQTGYLQMEGRKELIPFEYQKFKKNHFISLKVDLNVNVTFDGENVAEVCPIEYFNSLEV